MTESEIRYVFGEKVLRNRLEPRKTVSAPAMNGLFCFFAFLTADAVDVPLKIPAVYEKR